MTISEFELRHPELSQRWQHVSGRFAVVSDGKAFTVHQEKRRNKYFWYMTTKITDKKTRKAYVGKEPTPAALLKALDKLRSKFHNA